MAGVAGSCSFGQSRVLLRGRRSRREDGRLDRLSMCCGCATSRPGGINGPRGWLLDGTVHTGQTLGQVMIQVKENIDLKCLAVEDCLTVLSCIWKNDTLGKSG